MGGTIGLESEPGKGSTFWLEVRLAKLTAEGRRAIEPDERLAGVRVLGVDDAASNREILQAQLTAAGMVCDTASDGVEALRMLRDAARTQPYQPYALAVLDHHMPGLDGRELARRVTADARLRSTRLVMLGSVANPLDVGEQRALGIVGYCTKPIRRKQLLHVLRAALDGEFPPEAESRDRARTVREAPARLLLVEDSDINAEVAGEILRSAGYDYDLATDGAHAVACAKARPYDLILMDCQLPEVDGYEATRRIRALEKSGGIPGRDGKPIPVVALTASASKEDIDRCVAAGMSEHVSKPVDARRLLTVIAGHLGESAPPRARPSRPPSVPVADLTRALQRLSGDRALLRRIARQFSEAAAATILGLRTAVDSRTPADIAFAAHRLKGQASTFGGDALIAATEALKETATSGNWTAASASLLAVESELDRLLRALSSDAAI
jgi:CheY-like chemotaxis protein